ncbi:MAG: hypothetical protein KIS92_26515 [Planctomycetota bacterium]|nr:hypothetical protein [Planctomycetota bacterium]
MAERGGGMTMVLLLGGALVLVAGAGYVWIKIGSDLDNTKAMTARFEELSTVPASKAPDGPYLRGKAVVYDLERRDLDGVMWSIDPAIRAGSVDEIGSVILLDRKQVKVGKYVRVDREGKTVKDEGPKEDALIEVCVMTVVDRQASVVSAVHAFRGKEPDEVKRAQPGGNIGYLQPHEIIAVIDQLPRK